MQSIDTEQLFKRYQKLDEAEKMYFFPRIFGRMQSEMETAGRGKEFFKNVQDILDDLEEERKEAV